MLTFITLFACTDTKTTDTSPVNELGSNGIIMATVAMDYSVGALATFDTETSTLTENISSISGDPALVMDGGWLWQLNRYQYDTLRKYDPSNLQVPVAEISLAPDVGSSNPHDVAVCGDALYVSLYGSDSLPILDLDSWKPYPQSTSVNGPMTTASPKPLAWWSLVICCMLDCNDSIAISVLFPKHLSHFKLTVLHKAWSTVGKWEATLNSSNGMTVWLWSRNQQTLWTPVS